MQDLYHNFVSYLMKCQIKLTEDGDTLLNDTIANLVWPSGRESIRYSSMLVLSCLIVPSVNFSFGPNLRGLQLISCDGI